MKPLVHHVARRGGEGFGRDAGPRRNALHKGVHGRRENARLVLGSLGAGEPRQGRHALGGDCRIGRDSVVGLAIPGRKGEDLDLWRDESEAAGEVLLPLSVAGHMNQDGRTLDAPRQAARQIGDRECVEAIRNAGERQALAFLEGVEGAGQYRLHDGVSGQWEGNAGFWTRFV